MVNLLRAIAQSGHEHKSFPLINDIEPFSHYFKGDGSLDYENLDKRDGACTRRELLLRFLVLNAVLDQGPDIVGVRKMLIDVTNSLYRREIRFLHTPVEFFKELGVSIDQIIEKHQTVKELRKAIWGNDNQTNPEKYNLFMDNSKQALNYAIFRWGVPLALPLLLEKDCADDDEKKSTALVDYLEFWESAETMSQQLKDNERYGLGKAIGDKACHLFAKWMVSSFCLTRKNEVSWDEFSYEVPYDSNAGRILWRTGYFLQWATKEEFVKANVIQVGAGKQGLDYLRITNIRGVGASTVLPENIQSCYSEIAVNHLKSHRRPPRKVEIQRIQHAYLLEDYENTGLSVSDFDEGLIYIGTNFCFNHDKPNCEHCPIEKYCQGLHSSPELIANYRT